MDPLNEVSLSLYSSAKDQGSKWMVEDTKERLGKKGNFEMRKLKQIDKARHVLVVMLNGETVNGGHSDSVT